jgi:hypothetical protein
MNSPGSLSRSIICEPPDSALQFVLLSNQFTVMPV